MWVKTRAVLGASWGVGVLFAQGDWGSGFSRSREWQFEGRVGVVEAQGGWQVESAASAKRLLAMTVRGCGGGEGGTGWMEG